VNGESARRVSTASMSCKVEEGEQTEEKEEGEMREGKGREGKKRDRRDERRLE
jgi:hypothetical protein